MKNIYILLAVVFIGGALNAQNVEFVDENGDALPDTLTIIYDQDDAYLEEHNNLTYYDGFMKNKTGSNIDLVLSREVLAYVTDSVEIEKWGEMVWEKPDDQFCWGLCYIYGAEDTYIELGPVALLANAEEKLESIVHYTHYKIPGITSLKYKAVNGLSVEDEIVINFVINNIVSNKENNLQQVKLYPNPCESEFYLTNLNDIKHVEISNILGQAVFSSENNGNQMQINMSAVTNGIYMVTLTDANNNIRTDRIVKQ